MCMVVKLVLRPVTRKLIAAALCASVKVKQSACFRHNLKLTCRVCDGQDNFVVLRLEVRSKEVRKIELLISDFI